MNMSLTREGQWHYLKTIKNSDMKMKRGIAKMAVTWFLMMMGLQAGGQTYLTSLDEVTTGYYKVYSLAYDMTMAMSESATGSTNVYVDTPDASDYMQVWRIEVAARGETTLTVRLQNAVTQRWINRSNGNFHTWPTAMTFTMNLSEKGFAIYNGGGLHHQQNGHDVVSWDANADASKWQLEAVTVDDEALAAQQATYNDFITLVNNKATITTALATYFTDASCGELRDAYKGYSDDELTAAMTASALPLAVINMALKVKNGAWEVYQEGWRYDERTFRIGTYRPVSKASQWRNLVGVGYALAPNSDPTGIAVSDDEVVTVYVNGVPSGGTLMLRNVARYNATGDGYTLTAGFNVLKMQAEGVLMVDYEVDNTTSGAAPFTAMSTYPDVTIHIEGGQVNGAFSTLRGDTDDDWLVMQEKLFKHYDYLQLRNRSLIYNMNASRVMAACPAKMTEMLEQWDQVVEMEHRVMGLDTEFPGYFNTPMMAVSINYNYMFASTYGTYYNESTLSEVMSNEHLFAGGSLWGPAHEIGHVHQAKINTIGQSEVSNNLFSNIAILENGHLTSRAEYIHKTFENMANGVYWQNRGIWERTHLYFQLYQFFHVQGYAPTFYPDFFHALRADPTRRVQNVFVDATDDYLKFYRKACEVSGYDLTELFQAYGFFVVPDLVDKTIEGVTKQVFEVGDYGTFYLVVTQAMIDEAIAAVKAMKLKKANAVFIEDRVTAPLATYAGAAEGTKKTAFSGYPIGKGDVGQYTDFVPTIPVRGYSVTTTDNGSGGLDVTIGHSGASGAVGFKVYDANGALVMLSNSYAFTIPKAIYDGIKGTAFRVMAAGADGRDYLLTGEGQKLAVVMNAHGVMTYASDYALDFTSVGGLTAHYASGFSSSGPDSGILTMTQAAEVPAGEGLLLRGTAGESYDVPMMTAAAPLDPANMMVGLTEATTVQRVQTIGSEEYTSFILAKKGDDINWYRLAEDAYVLKANSAYLPLRTSDVYVGGSAREVVMDFDGGHATGMDDGRWYSVDGVRLSGSPVRHGVYVRNGRKIVK